MAMTSRLNEDESEALGREAAEEGRSMQDVAGAAVNRLAADDDAEFRTMVAAIVDRDRALLDRLEE